MNKLLFVLFALPFYTNAQNTGVMQTQNNNSMFQLRATSGIGFAGATSKETPKVTGNTISNGVSLSYKLSNTLQIETGANYTTFTNSSVTNGDYNTLDMSFIQIPVKLDMTLWELKPNSTKFLLNFGMFAEYTLSNELNTKTITSKSDEKGWYFGSVGEVGLEFRVADHIHTAVYFSNAVSPDFMRNDKVLSLKNNSQVRLSVLFDL